MIDAVGKKSSLHAAATPLPMCAGRPDRTVAGPKTVLIVSRLSTCERTDPSTHITSATSRLSYLSCLSASPCPWKNANERPKSRTKIATSEITTADVVDSPTPLAPPDVVKPHAQLI